jgi:hypothetical protein
VTDGDPLADLQTELSAFLMEAAEAVDRLQTNLEVDKVILLFTDVLKMLDDMVEEVSKKREELRAISDHQK